MLPMGPGWRSGFPRKQEAWIGRLAEELVCDTAIIKTFKNLQTIAAASASFWITLGLRKPLSRVKKAGKSTEPSRPSAKVPTQTPSVSRYSRVRGISKKLLHPELITVTGVRPSSVRSAVFGRRSVSSCTAPSYAGRERITYQRYPWSFHPHGVHHLNNNE